MNAAVLVNPAVLPIALAACAKTTARAETSDSGAPPGRDHLTNFRDESVVRRCEVVLDESMLVCER